VIEVKEYKILYQKRVDESSARELEQKVNLMVKDGWHPISISSSGGVANYGILVLLERESEK
jgi:hypothetical protein